MRVRALLPGAALLLSLATSQACAPAPPEAGVRSADLPVRIQHLTHPDGVTESVAVEPLRIGATPSITADAVVLSVGALYAHRPGPDEGFHALALVIRTESRGGGPIFASDREFLLSLDGEFVASRALPGGDAYRVEESARGGVLETLMVPVTPQQLTELAEASEVRGRIGPWYSFVLPAPHRRAVASILAEIPTDVSYNRAPEARRVIALQ